VPVFDGDPQTRAKDRDRDRALYVVDAALRGGQISQQDRDLRVERVHSAATVGELSALVRDLAGAPAPLPPTAVVPPPTAVPTAAPTPAPTTVAKPTPIPADLYGPPPSETKPVIGGSGTSSSTTGGPKFLRGCLVLLAVFIGLPLASAVVLFTVDQSSRGIVTTAPAPAGPPFELTRVGLQQYVAAFGDTFGDTEVVRSVFYDGYVVSWVPDDDGNVAIWNYREGAFEQLGDPMADTMDTAPVDLADLKPARVMSLVRRANRTLDVDGVTTTYVIYDRGIIDGTPQLAVFVNNGDGDSGYLLGDLEGNVLYTSQP
jgi:hypothetical protein